MMKILNEERLSVEQDVKEEVKQEEVKQEEVKQEEAPKEEPNFDYVVVITVDKQSENNFNINVNLGRSEGVSLYDLIGVLENAKNEVVMQMFLKALSVAAQPAQPEGE